MCLKTGTCILFLSLCLLVNRVSGQGCTTLGQSPATAFPVCGTTVFEQESVPLCDGGSLFVPGCSDRDNSDYSNHNPYWYKFTCYEPGTLGFTITPKDSTDDYDWQLYDITGLEPMDVFTNQHIIVAGNWAGNPGPTGASASGKGGSIQCASLYDGTEPRFAKMPTLVVGHQYLLLVSHYTDTQSGYSLSFEGGSAVITDPLDPHLLKASPDCDGTKIRLKMNKKMRCNTLTAAGTEFTISPAVTNVLSAAATNCSASFDFDEIILTLNNPLPPGNYQVTVKTGTDNNTILDNCERGIPAGDNLTFTYTRPRPIPIDSVGKLGCAPNELVLYFSKRIQCSTIAPNGSNFMVTGPTPVAVTAAAGVCSNGLSDIIKLTLASPIYSKGQYTVLPQLSVNGGAVIDECGQILQPAPVQFTAADTVSATITFTNDMGCRVDMLHFTHDGAHDVNKWQWLINNTQSSPAQTFSLQLPATSTNSVRLVVSNGVCSDSTNNNVVLDNEVKANFEMPEFMCPEDHLQLVNTSSGLIDSYRWNYVVGSSNAQTPQPILFPSTNQQAVYRINLVVGNNTLGCTDALAKDITVLNNCFIAVPSAFTPNGDGLNDFLSPNNAIKAIDLEFKVFNRWGEVVFASRNWRERWNGKVGGVLQGTGVYVWFLSYTNKDTGKRVFQKGTTTLIR